MTTSTTPASPTVRAMVTVYASSMGRLQLKSSVASCPGSRDRDAWQEVVVSFTPLMVHTEH